MEALDTSHEYAAKPHVLTIDSREERVDRTQEVAGSIPASSIARIRHDCGILSFAVHARRGLNFVTSVEYPVGA